MVIRAEVMCTWSKTASVTASRAECGVFTRVIAGTGLGHALPSWPAQSCGSSPVRNHPGRYTGGFTSDVVAHLPLPVPPREGECWRLTEDDVRAWLHDVGWLTPNAGTQSERNERNLPGGVKAHNAHAQQAEPRRLAIRAWQERLRRVATLFQKRAAA